MRGHHFGLGPRSRKYDGTWHALAAISHRHANTLSCRCGAGFAIWGPNARGSVFRLPSQHKGFSETASPFAYALEPMH
jgi:hypothetical protein